MKEFGIAEHGKTFFQTDDYTPHGYLNNPIHSGVMHPSGLFRSVPPMGYGFWRAQLRGYAGDKIYASNSYVSLLRPALFTRRLSLITSEDFKREGIAVVSRYHTSLLQSYDFEADGLAVSLCYGVDGEDALLCRVTVKNQSDAAESLRFAASHLYGRNTGSWWGSDAVTGRYVSSKGALVSKILAGGDVFAVLASETPANAAVFKQEERMWEALASQERFRYPGPTAVMLPQPLYSGLLWEWELAPGEERILEITLARGKNEAAAFKRADEALKGIRELFAQKMREDSRFYAWAPRLSGDFPDSWRRGWVYDFETLRMMVRQPMGIYRHRWDAMQLNNPRVVLGETAIDMETLSYADPETAKEVMLGIFADAPAPQVPCSREDGSVNMIGDDGSECGTAPIWGMPLRVVRTLYFMSGDRKWLSELYPYLKRFVWWWKENRTDKEGFYHCNNSWESGQDGSRRFVVEMDRSKDSTEGANAEFVRTADLEASMASAFDDMALFARILHEDQDIPAFEREREEGRARIRSMFVDKVNAFCDFDARTGEPFLPPDYFDLMLSMPAAVGMADEEQVKKAAWLYDAEYGKKEKGGSSLMWPPCILTAVRGALGSGRQDWAAEHTVRQAHISYEARDTRELLGCDPQDPLRYRIPGVAYETLAGTQEEMGCENYGWGALLPMLLLESVLGLKPESPDGTAFSICPVLPENLTGKRFVFENLHYGRFSFSVILERSGSRLDMTVHFTGDRVVCRGAEELPDGEGGTRFSFENVENVRRDFAIYDAKDSGRRGDEKE